MIAVHDLNDALKVSVELADIILGALVVRQVFGALLELELGIFEHEEPCWHLSDGRYD